MNHAVNCFLLILKLRSFYNLKSFLVGPNNWTIFPILTVTTGEGVGPLGAISPEVCKLKNGLHVGPCSSSKKFCMVCSPKRINELEIYVNSLLVLKNFTIARKSGNIISVCQSNVAAFRAVVNLEI